MVNPDMNGTEPVRRESIWNARSQLETGVLHLIPLAADERSVSALCPPT